MRFHYWVISCFRIINMNEILNDLLLTRDKFITKMHLKQPRFNYSAFGPLSKNKERIQKHKEGGDTKYIYRNELDEALRFIFGMIWLMEILKI